MSVERVISARRIGMPESVNDWWRNHMEQYLRYRGYSFRRDEDLFFVTGDDFTIRLIAQRYGQDMIGIPSGAVTKWEKLWQ